MGRRCLLCDHNMKERSEAGLLMADSVPSALCGAEQMQEGNNAEFLTGSEMKIISGNLDVYSELLLPPLPPWHL